MTQLDHILYDFAAQLNNTEHLIKYLHKLLSVMEYDIPYTADDLIAKPDMKSKESFRKNYLHPAMGLGLIQMTLPDNPNSRNQRYIKV